MQLERVMPALTSLTISATAPIGRVLASFAGRAQRGLKQLAERFRNRRDTMRLAELDDRMLADIGLNRSDLRDAFGELPWRDPSDVLARRAAERRVGRRLTYAACASAAAAPVARCYPATNRPARYTV
jgi:uncharacterized protein YjiS (DUF1127 family)